MSQLSRLALAVLVIVVDAAVFFVPLSALFLAYVLLVNPPWFRELINGLDRPAGGGNDRGVGGPPSPSQ